MDVVVAVVLHSNAPVAVVDKVELPQLSTSVTKGAEGVLLGDAVFVPDMLVQPFTVVVTLYVPAAVIVTEEVVAEMLQSNAPVAVVDKVEVLLQLSTSVTTGVDGVVPMTATPVPAALAQLFTVVVTL